jgi:hypothetical protein
MPINDDELEHTEEDGIEWVILYILNAIFVFV